MENYIVAATQNKDKIKEMKAIVEKLGFEIVPRDEAGVPPFEIEEDGATFEENSFKKANEIMKVCGRITLADDSGLMVDALDGAPGVHSARFAGDDCIYADNNAKLLKLLEGVPYEKRTAKFVTVITVVYPDGKVLVARGECHGRIGTEMRGDKGFGYDPLFIPDGYDKTFAELGSDVKNKIGHRANALVELGRILSCSEND